MTFLRVLALAAALVVGVSACAGHPANPANPAAVHPAQALGFIGQDVPDVPATTTTTTAEPPATDPYRRLTGPGGISVEVPADWADDPGSASYRQVGEADPAGAFARFGGYAPTRSSLLAEITAGERGNPKIRPGYHRISLSATGFQGVDAVDWQFTFDKDGVTRQYRPCTWRVTPS